MHRRSEQWCHSLGLVPRSWDFRSYLGTLGLFAKTLGLFLGTFFEKCKCDFVKNATKVIIFIKTSVKMPTCEGKEQKGHYLFLRVKMSLSDEIFKITLQK